MKTVREIFELFQRHLEAKGVLAPRRSAEDLIAYAMKTSRMNVYLQFDKVLEEAEVSAIRELLKLRATGLPVSYIIGSQQFLDVTISLTKDVLIPRPETEILVSEMIEQIKNLSGKVVVDLCCGSGAIGIALKKRLPDLHVIAVDIDQACCEITKANAQANGCDIEVIQGDFVQPILGRKVDFIISNPPYISKKEYEALHREVKEFEPEKALTDYSDGLSFYKTLAQLYQNLLNPGGKVFLEVGDENADAVYEIFEKTTPVAIRIGKDWSGKKRFIFLDR